jgi:hypothetical protein
VGGFGRQKLTGGRPKRPDLEQEGSGTRGFSQQRRAEVEGVLGAEGVSQRLHRLHQQPVGPPSSLNPRHLINPQAVPPSYFKGCPLAAFPGGSLFAWQPPSLLPCACSRSRALPSVFCTGSENLSMPHSPFYSPLSLVGSDESWVGCWPSNPTTRIMSKLLKGPTSDPCNNAKRQAQSMRLTNINNSARVVAQTPFCQPLTRHVSNVAGPIESKRFGGARIPIAAVQSRGSSDPPAISRGLGANSHPITVTDLPR